MIRSPLASMPDLLTIHSEKYVTSYFAGQLTELEQKTIGFPWSPANVKRALASTGGWCGCSEAPVYE